ncbi:hypothetical protein D3C71_1809320 [compost metagenome]
MPFSLTGFASFTYKFPSFVTTMCLALPMLSATTKAPNPAGSFKPALFASVVGGSTDLSEGLFLKAYKEQKTPAIRSGIINRVFAIIAVIL